MRYTVESWDPDYGAPSTAELEDASENVDVNVGSLQEIGALCCPTLNR
jgi:hypothetical protein